MRNDLEDAIITVVVVILLVGGLMALCWGLAVWQCSSRWSESGMNTKWRPVAGCLLEVKAGKWIPEERYREVEQ